MRTPLLAIAASLVLCGVGVGDVINEDFKLLASDGAELDRFGRSVSISGDTALIGAYYDDDNSGSAYVYRFNGSSWIEEAKLLASDGAASDQFGNSVSISGDTAVIGAFYDDDNGTDSGSAYVFRFDGTQWTQEAKLLASEGAADEYFGYSVSISGDTALIGAIYDDDNGTNSGSVYVFRFDGKQWTQEAKLLASDEGGYNFGNSVSISGDTALIGVPYDDDNGFNSGSACVFRFDGTQWTQEAKLLASDGAADEYFGYSVSISGDTAVIGAQNDDDNGNSSGSAYVYRFVDGEWVEEGKLLSSDGAVSDYFGNSVSISGDTAVIGAYFDDDNGSFSGSAYVYRFNGSEWIEVAKLLASDGEYGDYFGRSVSISGDTVLIGAHHDDDIGNSSGSAYVFDVTDSDGDGVPDDIDNCYLYNPEQLDCNGNGIGDVCDVADQTSFDCNQNIIPDECESDCDGDGLIDDCDNDPDIDGNGIPDNCEEDCNGNSLPDHWEIKLGLVTDCNGNLVPDECDLNDGTAQDCNENAILDTCEIADGSEEDCDEDGVPDSCALEEVFQQETQLLASDGAEHDYFGISVSISGESAIIGAEGHEENGKNSGSAYIFRFADGEWTEESKLLASDGAAGDIFGESVAISGDTALIGSRSNDDSGSAYVFRFNGRAWIEESKLLASDGAASDYFGHSVSISGDTALIGAYGDDGNSTVSGSAYVYRFNGSEWIEEAKLIPTSGGPYQHFGISVSISGESAIIGALGDDENGNSSGSAYIYRFDGSEWVEEAKLLASDGAEHDYFGSSVSVSGETALIGAEGDGHRGKYSGSAYIYRFDGSQWVEETKLLLNDGAEYDFFGRSVSISGESAIIGAEGGGRSHNTGSAYIYRFDGSQWIEEAKLLANNGAEYDYFGHSVSISGETALIGAFTNDDNGWDSGSSYVFSSFSLWDCNENDLVDTCEIEDDPFLDCDLDGVLDNCAIAGGDVEDCNTNGIPDSCDIADGTADDQNGNGIIDECECLGDISDGTTPGETDGLVNVNDLLAVIGFWGSDGPIGDINFDGIVGVDDLLLVIGAWGECP